MFHVDCNDDTNVFDDIKNIRKWSKTPIDLHIISKTPEKYFPLLEKNPCDFITFQHEDLIDKLEIPSYIKGKLGLAITAASEIDAFEQYAGRFDFILMMATIPGKSGGAFNKDIFRKIRLFKNVFLKKNSCRWRCEWRGFLHPAQHGCLRISIRVVFIQRGKPRLCIVESENIRKRIPFSSEGFHDER